MSIDSHSPLALHVKFSFAANFVLLEHKLDLEGRGKGWLEVSQIGILRISFLLSAGAETGSSWPVGLDR